MTPEERAAALPLFTWGDSREVRAVVAKAIREDVAEAVAAEREACARLSCVRCADGFLAANGKHWDSWTGEWHPCPAAAIRARPA